MAVSNYSLGERVFRTAVFQIAVSKGWLESAVIRTFNMCAKLTCSPQLFDTQRAERGLQSLIAMGAEIQFVHPRDQQASVQMMTMRAQDLENILVRLGGRWEELTLEDGAKILAIIPPEYPTAAWYQFEEHTRKFKWKREDVTTFQGSLSVIVTSRFADVIGRDNWHKNVFLHANSASVSFVMQFQRAGFYLGCKQDLCFYDPRGTWKSYGVASEGGFYNDIEAVCTALLSKYAPQNLWISSACGGCTSGSYLKAQLHALGVNQIIENGFSNLKTDFIQPHGWPVTSLANYFQSALQSRDISADNKPPETGFNTAELWKNLPFSPLGKVIVVNTNNDQYLNPAVSDRYTALAMKVNLQVCHLSFHSPEANPHMDYYYKYAAPTREVLQYIMNK